MSSDKKTTNSIYQSITNVVSTVSSIIVDSIDTPIIRIAAIFTVHYLVGKGVVYIIQKTP